MLTVENISKSYGQQQVLDQVNFELQRGQIVGLLGRNGAGKSTLLKILAGINIPDKGNINGLKDSKVAFMSERNPLYQHMYVRELLQWVAHMHGRNDPKESADQVIIDTGLTDMTQKRVGQLSKGYRQRLGLAAALLADPDVLILDEPINGLDPIQIKEYRQLIKRISAEKIIILSSHLMQEIEALCDRVLILKDGHIQEDLDITKEVDEAVSTIHLETNKAIDLDVLKGINGMIEVTGGYENIYLLKGANNSALREAIFDVVVDRGCKILEFRTIDRPQIEDYID